jgi:hypothetical protein
VSIRRALLVVPVAARDAANALCSTYAVSPAQSPDFAVALTTNGFTITHYACCPDPGPELTGMLDALKGHFPGSDYRLWEGDYDRAAAEAWLATKGLVVFVGSPGAVA